jgi:putative flippase GtrA
MEIKLTKKDLWLSVLAGEIVAWLSLPTLKNLKLLDALAGWGIGLISFSIFWAIFVPVMAVLGLLIFYYFAKYKQNIGFFQFSKYAVAGTVNTVLNAGVYNLLIYTTNISSGLAIDMFFVIAFVIAVINSFIWNKFWVFEEKRMETMGQEAFQFFAVSAVVAIVNTAILHVIINIIGAPYGIDPKLWANIALALTIITAFLGNFFGYKFIVFKK